MRSAPPTCVRTTRASSEREEGRAFREMRALDRALSRRRAKKQRVSSEGTLGPFLPHKKSLSFLPFRINKRERERKKERVIKQLREDRKMPRGDGVRQDKQAKLIG